MALRPVIFPEPPPCPVHLSPAPIAGVGFPVFGDWGHSIPPSSILTFRRGGTGVMVLVVLSELGRVQGDPGRSPTGEWSPKL